MATELLGCTEPRVYTPEKRELTRKTSLGFAVIEFAETCLHMKLFPWQKWLLIHALELNPDGTYRFRTVVVEIARQNGKTTIQIILALFHMYVLRSPLVIGTAQDLDNAGKAWGKAVMLAQNDAELGELIPDDGVYMGHPQTFTIVHQEQDDDGRDVERTAQYQTTADGRGASADLILLDELRTHKTWDDWAAITNTMNARPKAQCWCFSNAPDATGVVLRYLRALAHQELGWPDDDQDTQGVILGEIAALPEFEDMPEAEFDIGFYEWSMAPGLPRNHPEGLMQANPACNHTSIVENTITYRTLISGVRLSPAHVVEAEICCRETTMGVGGPFPEGSWGSTLIDVSKPEGEWPAPAAKSKIVVCVEVSTRREHTYIARAGLTKDGLAVLGMQEDRPGTDWVKQYLLDERKTFATIVVRTGAASPVQALLKELQDARLPILEWKGNEIPAAHGQMFDRLRDSRIAHLPHAGMDNAATSAVERNMPGGGWVLDHNKSPTDVAPLLAGLGAVWGLAHLPPTPRIHGWDPDKIKEWAK